MQMLRVPPYEIQISIGVDSPATIYPYSIKDMADSSVIYGEGISNNKSKIVIDLPSEYDTSYIVNVSGEEYFVEVVRPYVNPNLKSSVPSEIEEYAKNEEIARAIIDSIVEDGFYLRKEILSVTGLGADLLPIWKRPQKLLKLYENNVKVFDTENESAGEFSYGLSNDKSSIQILYPGPINLAESAPTTIPQAVSDSSDIVFGYRGFPKGFDYVAVVESGYRTVPSDIQRATEMLIEDLACGRLEYYKKYAIEYNTDQFKIKFDRGLFEGTGNILVDKILSKYKSSVKHIGVL